MSTSSASDSIIVGTAGHVDHGKSSLVKALTGTDPDRLPQEKARGMTIDLGFANFALPSGREVSFVDVPGHERLVATMVAGASGFDLALLVVAADEGVMPQTREHIAIIDLLRVAPGLIAITKTDLVDGETIEMVRADIAEATKGSVLHGTPMVPVSAVTGQGLQALVETMEGIARRDKDDTAVTRLVVDRMFSMPGFGTVVTGTGTGRGFSAGDTVHIHPGNRSARVRGVQRHGQARTISGAGRTALNLAGIETGAVSRGDVIAPPGVLEDCLRFDARIELLAGAGQVLQANQDIVVHAGAVSIRARAFPLTRETLKPGEEGWAQFRLPRPVSVWRGQRFVLRSPSPARTVGGGIIGDIAPVRRARDTNRERLDMLLSSDTREVILATLAGRKLNHGRVTRLTGLPAEAVTTAVHELQAADRVIDLGGKLCDRGVFDTLARRLETTLRLSHAGQPERLYMPKEELRQALRLTSGELRDLVSRLAATSRISIESTAGGDVALPAHLAQTALNGNGPGSSADQILKTLTASGFQPPNIDDMVVEFGLDRETVRQLERSGDLVRIEQGMYLPTELFGELVNRLARLIEQEPGGITIAQLRDQLETSRKYALAFAGYLDANRLTRRVGDLRVAGKNLDQKRRQLAHSG